jgi:hypothetical protein
VTPQNCEPPSFLPVVRSAREAVAASAEAFLRLAPASWRQLAGVTNAHNCSQPLAIANGLFPAISAWVRKDAWSRSRARASKENGHVRPVLIAEPT